MHVTGVDAWLIVGARRWARMVAGELCALLPPGAPIHLQGSLEDADLLEWWSNSPFKYRIRIVDQPTTCCAPMTGVALIVNSAYQHRPAVEMALSAGYHVACEKPLTFSRLESLQLMRRADDLGLKLFSTNTYLFADYLRIFKQDWLRGNRHSEIRLTWSDAAAEARYGQAKPYDSGVPLVFDLLPHIASIVLATHGPVEIDHAELTVHRGGSEVEVRFGCRDLTICASLSRNAKRRTRLVHFLGATSSVELDFSVEPGLVSLDEGAPACVDLAWETKRKPIAEMLRSLHVYFGTGAIDERLGLQASLLGNVMIDSVAESYVQQQNDFLYRQPLAPGGDRDPDYRYATKELNSVSQRALPFLPQESPLRSLGNRCGSAN